MREIDDLEKKIERLKQINSKRSSLTIYKETLILYSQGTGKSNLIIKTAETQAETAES